MVDEDYARRFDEFIEQHGVGIQFVGPDDAGPGFGYTVGVALVDHAEFVLVGLPVELSQQLLNDMAFAVLRSGMRFEAGALVDHLIGSFSVALAPVDDPSEYLPLASIVRDRRRPEASGQVVRGLQIVLPDRNGLFPWEQDEASTGALLGSFVSSGERLVLPSAEDRRADGW